MTEKILLISGKRKCGKDFISEKLLNSIGQDTSVIVRISEPIKTYYAEKHNLNLSELMSDNAYKEKYRQKMILWSDQIRLQDPGYFCKAACDKAPIKPIWIISDIRRKSDIKWFSNTFGNKIRTVRISANPEIRKQRGWVFTMGVDDVASECDLDDYNEWNLEIDNNNDENCDIVVEKVLYLLK